MIERGDIVSYAGRQCIVREADGDLLVLSGVASNIVMWADGDGSGTAGKRCTVLATDVTLVAKQARMEGS